MVLRIVVRHAFYQLFVIMGGDIAKGRLIELVKTTKDGTSFYNISLAASHLGFAAKGFKVAEIDKIKKK